MDDQRFDDRTRVLAHDLSRRTLLRRLGGGGLVAVAGYQLGHVGAAAQATPGALPAPLDEWVAAWEAADAARLVAVYAEDAVFEDVIGGATLPGRAAIEAYFVAFFDAFSDPSPAFSTVFAADNRAAGEWAFAGRYTGQFPGLPPGAGQAVSFQGASFLTLRDGLIALDTEYVDYVAVLRQVGVLPSAPATPDTEGMATPSS